MINTRMGVVAASKGGTPAPTYYSIAISGSYQLDGRANNVDLYWNSGSGYNYVTTVTSGKQTCGAITTLTVVSGSAIGSIKFTDPVGNSDVTFGIVNDPACASVVEIIECVYDLGTATGNTTWATVIGMINNDPSPPTFNNCG